MKDEAPPVNHTPAHINTAGQSEAEIPAGEPDLHLYRLTGMSLLSDYCKILLLRIL